MGFQQYSRYITVGTTENGLNTLYPWGELNLSLQSNEAKLYPLGYPPPSVNRNIETYSCELLSRIKFSVLSFFFPNKLKNLFHKSSIDYWRLISDYYSLYTFLVTTFLSKRKKILQKFIIFYTWSWKSTAYSKDLISKLPFKHVNNCAYQTFYILPFLPTPFSINFHRNQTPCFYFH